MTFDAPYVLYVAPLVAFGFAALGWWGRRARVRRAARWSAELGAIARRNNRFGAVGIGVAVLAAMTALAGPRWGRQVVTTESPALDLVIAADISRSMLAEDVPPSRLARARSQISRIVHDQRGDRIGLIAFAGRSFILSPLTGDEGALQLLVDALDPDIASAGGTDLAAALTQGRQLLGASRGVADRVLVVVTDGEAQDSLPEVLAAAAALHRNGIRLILVAEGGNTPARIPVRNADDSLLGYQKDDKGQVVLTTRRDDILSAVADAGQGALVAAGLPDQAGAVRDLLAAYKRAPESTSTTALDVPRGWIPLLVAVVALFAQAVTRRSAALAAILLTAGLTVPGRAAAQAPRNGGDMAWRRGAFRDAAAAYLRQARRGVGGDTTWYDAGTAAMAAHDVRAAQQALGRAAGSLDPDLRFRALYNLGLLDLRLADADSVHRLQHLAEARARYREALLLRPGDSAAKWNYELAIAETPPGGGGGNTPQSGGGGGSGSSHAPPQAPQDLTKAQAEQILASIAHEERETRLAMQRRRAQMREHSGGKKNW